MSTYEELQLIVSIAVLIVAILNYTPQCASCRRLFIAWKTHFSMQ